MWCICVFEDAKSNRMTDVSIPVPFTAVVFTDLATLLVIVTVPG